MKRAAFLVVPLVLAVSFSLTCAQIRYKDDEQSREARDQEIRALLEAALRKLEEGAS